MVRIAYSGVGFQIQTRYITASAVVHGSVGVANPRNFIRLVTKIDSFNANDNTQTNIARAAPFLLTLVTSLRKMVPRGRCSSAVLSLALKESIFVTNLMKLRGFATPTEPWTTADAVIYRVCR